MSATARMKDNRRVPSRDQGRVLLVADDPGLSAFAQALEECGFVVAGVAGGAKALVALQRARPHVVIADTKLKGVSAKELIRMLSDPQDATPVVLVGTERATVEARGEAM
ncbi:MAG TPA: response regulator, partial [Pyrinomonadaceae bacterium]|nr:response regulator [Pyrinomonadaceae bacterium]